MNLKKIIQWQSENPMFRSFKIEARPHCNTLIPKYYESVFLYEYKHDDLEDKRCVLFPLELLSKIKDINDFEKIEKMVKKYEKKNDNGKQGIPMYLYVTERSSFNLKGHYLALCMVDIPKIKEFAKDKEFEGFFIEAIEIFVQELKEVITIDDINNNNMEVFDIFYSKLEEFYAKLRQHLIDNYNYIDLKAI